MKLCYDTTLDDMRIFNRFLRKRSRTARLSKGLSIGIPAVLLLALTLSTANWETPVFEILWCIALPGGFVTLMLAVYERMSDWQAVRIYKEGNQKGMLGPHELEVSESGVAGKTEVSAGSVGWAGLEEVAVTDRHAFVFLNAVSAYVVPRACCTDEEFKTFVAAVREGIASSKKVAAGKALGGESTPR